MSTYEEERRSRLKSKLNPVFKPEKYGKREGDLVITCNACGFKEKIEWKTGDLCPKCSSDKFFPVVHISNAVRVKRVAMGTVLVLVIVAVNLWTAWRLMGSPTTYHVKLICDKDGSVFEKRVAIDENFPTYCARWHWGQKTSKPAYQCAKGHIFGWAPSEEMKQVIMPTPENMFNIPKIICPVCGNDHASQMTVAVSPE